MRKNPRGRVSARPLGQHLLHNKHWIRTIIAQAKLASHEQVIDIGAGLGALTIPLAKRVNRVLAIEIDPKFADRLRRKTAMFKHVKVLELNFLQMPLPRQPYCVVANIPYEITTPILNKLLNSPSSSFQRAVLVIEKGAAKRFTEPFTTNPQLLTWRMWFDFSRGPTIEAANFSPPPNVESSIFTITRKKEPLLPFTAHTAFQSLVTHALKVPQQPICTALSDIFTSPQITRLCRNLGTDRLAPVQTLTEQQWAIVFQTMRHYVSPERWPKIKRSPRSCKRQRR